ncbi:MAG: sigma-70 family RNA polymerase sigma factor [Bryobacterales bacterium]|nr:sigma-70 family RNA polymerase sigma factor [Bryobacterales bacterium]
MEQTEAAAVDRARAGDGDAFRVLVERHSRSVYRLAFRLTGNEQDAEDVVQETFLRAFKQLDRYDGRAAFHTWVYRIAANYALDLLRSRKRVEQPREDDQATVFDQLRATGPAADRLVYADQVKRKLREAMDELSEQERAAFVLRHFEGLSIEEIGGTLGVGESATKNSIFRAVRKLRRSLEPLVMGAAK